MKTGELIDEVTSLPVEERARVVDMILRSLNAPESAIDTAWLEVAQRRIVELRQGQATAIPGEAVFERIRQRYINLCRHSSPPTPPPSDFWRSRTN